MNKERLFEYLKTQDQATLLDLLNLAFDTIDTNQRHAVFGKIIIEVPPSPVEGKKFQITIKEFYEKSMAGHYYAPFDINSKNFSDIPEETDVWFDEMGDYLEDCSRLSLKSRTCCLHIESSRGFSLILNRLMIRAESA
jgi:hypothetical protein